MKEITYPSPNAWINSCLISANSYKILSDQSEFERSFLEEDSTHLQRLGGEHHYARVAANRDRQDAWMLLFSMNSADMNRLAEVLETVQVNFLYQNGFFWPFDLVWDHEIKGCLIHPIDTIRFQPLRLFLGKPNLLCWTLAKSLFSRIDILHRAKLTLNGFAREQLRVDVSSNEVFFWPTETCGQLDIPQSVVRRGGYCSIPQKMETLLLRAGWTITGGMRDLFSAAVLAFYLLYLTHPFVGTAFLPRLREEYNIQYQNFPDYIMDPNGNNRLGFSYEHQLIQKQWERSAPELKALFDGLFLAMCHPDQYEYDAKADYWSPARWIEALEADRQKNGMSEEEITANYVGTDWDMVQNYQV
ncbi:hypothetical protein H7U37_11675 [Pseudoflavonifractor phocaeensis]|uniref:hypothetical protein n=1 Tax=Pseudoflavonifractor phocaeensis TaxID=1870988 RepID=UPI00195DB1EE|nr:hypothetical protein [Pseudoflavonifractor phocaeensis]MBM6871318.1 hypothetical protein [Pseudoflavonifractor phocaeensis]MBM6939172.1 hypothetical protein [Pseudoflavonifractor phocaeensis]